MTGPVVRSQTADRLDGLGRAALVGYLPVGYPDVPTSVEAVRALIDNGADVVELGMPYTDPLMDGPVIQHAVDAALRGGVRVRDTLRAVEQVAGRGAPILVMTYWNLVLRYGVEAFARDLAAAGGAGLITPDLIPDEAGVWIDASDEHGLDRVFLVAPSSTPERLVSTAAACRGFVYAASTMGVTGERATLGSGAERLVADTRAAGAAHVCVGLGVSRPDQAAQVATYADGVIVGSALVRAVTEGVQDGTGLDALARTTAALADGVRSAVRPGVGSRS
ncbi:tryptophan synthase subunit alpha [Cellulomonas soli]|uniref:Tryptophan synthase alpha chain n=1 Tax=Cellulomonas soli TaxID=931535 RepID=A0A512PHF3_9CELL|nr:tryptophan synthase subunit alpha [Cellulomonas soli]NYI60803.1 tryptophan synthase alpha chain [Cellulomonas soli]GEP70613.1 tryptophan synthase alpha chain [Cellulomonas soli]